MKKPNELAPTRKDISNGEEEDYLELSKAAALISQKIQHFSGPLPPPEMIKEYKKAFPDAPKIFFEMAKKAQDHYENMESKLVDLEIRKVPKGQNHAFIIALTGIIGAVFCAYLDQVTIGSIIGGSTLISLIPHFLGRKKNKGKEENPELEYLPEDNPKEEPSK